MFSTIDDELPSRGICSRSCRNFVCFHQRELLHREVPRTAPRFQLILLSLVASMNAFPRYSFRCSPFSFSIRNLHPLDIELALFASVRSQIRMTTPLPAGAAEGTVIPVLSAQLGRIDERISQVFILNHIMLFVPRSPAICHTSVVLCFALLNCRYATK
jgi:hypothetical protein